MPLSVVKWIAGILYSILMGIAAIIFSIIYKNSNAVRSVTRLWGKGMCRLSGVRVEVSGIENILKGRPQIFVSNHQGMYDIFVLEGYLPVNFLWIAKESLFKIPIIGWTMRRAGYIGINRTSPKKFLKSLGKAVDEIRNGKSIIIFPEGTRTRDGNVGRFKKGSLFLIFKTGVPVVPITISGSFDVLKKGEFRINSGKVRIHIDKPIEVKGSSDSEASSVEEGQLLNSFRDIIVNNLQGLKAE
ncbi:MAG: 1-acyl-sn-glycerol-3-phosphate acyltransferase [Nitrospinae bacterium]|nr:1-acyl-sn-glycerol-3-phosphate acyltransferase [Nitrospinota bacterium]